MRLRRVGILRSGIGSQRADELHETCSDLRRAENRHLGVNNPGNRVDDTALRRDDGKVVFDD